jgi:hypothetical protein
MVTSSGLEFICFPLNVFAPRKRRTRLPSKVVEEEERGREADAQGAASKFIRQNLSFRFPSWFSIGYYILSITDNSTYAVQLNNN